MSSLLTCGLHQLRVQAVGDQRVGQVGEERLQGPGSGVHRHVHHHEVDTVVCGGRGGERARKRDFKNKGMTFSTVCRGCFRGGATR